MNYAAAKGRASSPVQGRGFSRSGGSVILRVEAADLMKKLDGMGKYPAKRAFHAAGVYSTRLIDKETSRQYLAATYKSRPRKKGFRKRIRKKSAFKYQTKQTRGTLKFRSYLNFRHGEMHVGRWLEMGHAIGKSNRKVRPWMLRHRAFDSKVSQARKAFVNALRYALDISAQTKNGSVPMKTIEAMLGDPWR